MRHALSLLVAWVALAGAGADIDKDFFDPPRAARPQTWWHWMNNCVNPVGITNELRAIAAAGFGGVHLFNTGWCTSAPAEPVTPFLSDGWKRNLRTSLALCRELGLGFTAQNGAGWSGTGGPWVAPSNGMLVVTIEERRFKGGETATIAKPCVWKVPRTFPQKAPRWYGDIAVLAFPLRGRNVLAASEIRDLTSSIAADGTVTFAAPADKRDWVLLRVGCRNNGRINDPSPEGSFGPVGSVLDRRVTEDHLSHYFDQILAEDRALGGGIVKGLLLDSWESDSQNWSHDFPFEFKRRRGYDVRALLPTFAGYVVDSPERTVRMKADHRRTVDELLKENYFDIVESYCRRHGLRHIVEGFSCGAGVFDGEPLTPYLACDIPMTEAGDVFAAVEAARMRDIPEVAYEAHTGPADWDRSPRDFKRHEDEVFTKGITRLVMHTYAHNATPERCHPGPAFGNFGACLQLGQTWWPHARAWTDYISRCQTLLSRGKAADADMAGDVTGVHRIDGDIDIYFVCRRKARVKGAEMGFRVTGKIPQIFDPLAGAIYQCTSWHEKDGYTWLPMIEGEATEATRFVVFVPDGAERRLRAAGSAADDAAGQRMNEGVPVPVPGVFDSWSLAFDNLGFKTNFTDDVFFDWASRDVTCGYSGLAVYRGRFSIDGAGGTLRLQSGDLRYRLRLGRVDVSCEVLIDGRSCGVAWCEPYELDVTDAVCGKSSVELELRVVNTWKNRILADAQLPDAERRTWTTCTGLKHKDNPAASGLRGPVELVAVSVDVRHGKAGRGISFPKELASISPANRGESDARVPPILALVGRAEYPGFFYGDKEVVFPVMLKEGDSLTCDADGSWRIRSAKGELRATGKVCPIEDFSKIHDKSSCNPGQDDFCIVRQSGGS